MSRENCTVQYGRLIHGEDCECTAFEIAQFYADKADIAADSFDPDN